MKHLRYNQTVAMNTQQIADLGLSRGDIIYIRSNKGWSGFYEITDCGCAYGTIDIYIDYKYLPSWGVEYGATILTDDTLEEIPFYTDEKDFLV